jgi:hypothetical protein
MFDPLERAGQIGLAGVCLAGGIVIGADHTKLQPLKIDIA